MPEGDISDYELELELDPRLWLLWKDTEEGRPHWMRGQYGPIIVIQLLKDFKWHPFADRWCDHDIVLSYQIL